MSEMVARRIYGVVLDDSGAVDETASEEARVVIRNERLGRVEAAK